MMTTKTLSVPRTGFALGASLAVLYAGCMILMLSVSRESVVQFANSILHGIDVDPIMRWNMPLWEACLGVIEIFILGWFFGALFSSLYNYGLGIPPNSD